MSDQQPAASWSAGNKSKVEGRQQLAWQPLRRDLTLHPFKTHAGLAKGPVPSCLQCDRNDTRNRE